MKNTQIIVNDYTLILDNYRPAKNLVIDTKVKSEGIGFVFYGSGDNLVDINSGNKNYKMHKKKGMISSFYCNENATITHNVSHKKAMQKATVFLSLDKLSAFLNDEKALYHKHFKDLLNPKDNYVYGNSYLINPNIQAVLFKLFNTKHTGITQKLFIESQIIELLSYYFQTIEAQDYKKINPDIDKLYYAKDLLLNKIDTPPSLTELSKLTGLNNFKLKTGFKELFGLPVYKYLQNKRLEKAFELLENKDMSVQETAWFVGYESMGSFSNAFYKKFGYRPSEINK